MKPVADISGTEYGMNVQIIITMLTKLLQEHIQINCWRNINRFNVN